MLEVRLVPDLDAHGLGVARGESGRSPREVVVVVGLGTGEAPAGHPGAGRSAGPGRGVGEDEERAHSAGAVGGVDRVGEREVVGARACARSAPSSIWTRSMSAPAPARRSADCSAVASVCETALLLNPTGTSPGMGTSIGGSGSGARRRWSTTVTAREIALRAIGAQGRLLAAGRAPTRVSANRRSLSAAPARDRPPTARDTLLDRHRRPAWGLDRIVELAGASARSTAGSLSRFGFFASALAGVRGEHDRAATAAARRNPSHRAAHDIPAPCEGTRDNLVNSPRSASAKRFTAARPYARPLIVRLRRVDFDLSPRCEELLERIARLHGRARLPGRARGAAARSTTRSSPASPIREILVEIREQGQGRGALEPLPRPTTSTAPA